MRAGDNTDDIVTTLLESFLENYEREENILRNGSNNIFDYVDLTLMQFHSIELKRGSSYIPSPKWISDKRATINPQNTHNNKCFKYATIAALHHQEFDHHPQRITKLKPYINNYNQKDINFPAGQKDWKIFDRNNKDIPLNILSASSTEKKVNLIRKSDYNDKREKQVHLLMITGNENNWHYLTIKSISLLFRGVTSNNKGDFYSLNCLHSYRTKNALKRHERLCNNHGHCEVIMPTKDKNTLEYTSHEKSLRMPHMIYAELETLLRPIQSYQPNLENSYTENKNVHMPSGYALHLQRTYDENLITSYRDLDCMQKFVRALKVGTKMVINTPQKEMIPLTDEEKRSYKKSKHCHICKKEFYNDDDNKNYRKVRDHDHYTGK